MTTIRRHYGMIGVGLWRWCILILCSAKLVFTQPDVIFTAEPCGEHERGAYAPVPNDPHHYKQCGPAGFYWILPCAAETFFSADAQACVPKGSRNHLVDNLGGEQQQSGEYLVSYPALGLEPATFNKSDNFNVAFLSGAHAIPPPQPLTQTPSDHQRQVVVTPRPPPTSTGSKFPATRQPPVRIVIENHHGKLSHQPPAPVARDKQQSTGQTRQQQQQQETNSRQPESESEEEKPPPQMPPPGPAMGGPGGPGGPQMIMLPYPYPMMPYSPGMGQPNPQGGVGPPMGHTGGAPGAPPPAFFLMPPPPPPPRSTVEPEPPRLLSLVESCVENGTCTNEDEAAVDVFCLHDNDPTRYFVCSPHPEQAGVWVEQQCPAGLHFSGERCDRPARGSSSNSASGQTSTKEKVKIPAPAPAPAPAPVPETAPVRPRVPAPAPIPVPLPPPQGHPHQQQQQAGHYVYPAPEQSGQPPQPMLALPPGAEFVVEPNTTPQPGPNGHQWPQYALVNSAGIVQIHQGPPPPGAAPYEHRLPGVPLTSVGHQQPSKPPWYVRQPPPPPASQPAALPAPPSMVAVQPKSSGSNYESAQVFPTPPSAPAPPSIPAPVFAGPQSPGSPNRYPSPNWNNGNMIFPISTPPSTRWPLPPTLPNPALAWQNRSPHPGQLQPPPLQGPPGKPFVGPPYIDPAVQPKPGQGPLPASSLSQEQLYAVQQQQQQLAHGSLHVVPAIPGSRVAPNQFPSPGPPIGNSIHQFNPEYMFPYGRPQVPTRPLGITDYRPFPYPHHRDTSTPPTGSNAQPPEGGQGTQAPPDPPGSWPMVGQRCSLLVAPKSQIVADPGNRRSFYMCIPPGDGSANNWPFEASDGVWALMECPEDTVFNTVLKVCDKSHLTGQQQQRNGKKT